jgi:hypothetical protein
MKPIKLVTSKEQSPQQRGSRLKSSMVLRGQQKVSEVLQEHLFLAWLLFIFLLALAFYLYLEDYVCIHMQYLFWLTVLFPYLYWLYSLWSCFHSLCTIFAHRISGSIPYALPIPPVPTLLHPEPYTLLSVHDVVTPYPYRIHSWWLSPCHLYHSFSPWLGLFPTLTLPLVSDSVPFLPAYLCTTTYSLVCAQGSLHI